MPHVITCPNCGHRHEVDINDDDVMKEILTAFAWRDDLKDSVYGQYAIRILVKHLMHRLRSKVRG